jgi:hypothetical protein
MARLSRFAIAAVTAVATILLLTYGTYALRLWVGGHISIRDFVLKSSVLLPLVLGLCAAMWPSPKGKRGALFAGIAGALIGCVYGYLAPRGLALVMFRRALGSWGSPMYSIFLHPTFAWSVDCAAIVCSTVAGACAMLLSISSRGRYVLVSVAILLIAAVLVPGPVFDLVTHNQELTIAIVVPRDSTGPGAKPDVIADIYATPMDVGAETGHALQSLRDAGMTDSYQVKELFRQGHGKRVLEVIAITQPVFSKVELYEPSGANLIYVQGPDGWKKIPSQVHTLDRSVAVEPPLGENAIALLRVTEANGLTTGFEVWKASN